MCFRVFYINIVIDFEFSTNPKVFSSVSEKPAMNNEGIFVCGLLGDVLE
ncbi:MAG: hypothetical protein ACQERB_14400 [Promethearchaeati archaeon]